MSRRNPVRIYPMEELIALSIEQQLDVRIAELPLPSRAKNTLKCARIVFVGQLVRLNREDLLELKGMGEKSLSAIQGLLHEINLSLGSSHHNWLPLIVVEDQYRNILIKDVLSAALAQ